MAFGKLQDVLDKVVASSNRSDNNLIGNLVKTDIQYFRKFFMIILQNRV